MLGRRIGFARRRMGLSQAELSERLGVSPAAVGAYEQGRRSPSAAILVALSRTLGISVEFLLTGKPGDQSELFPAAEYALEAQSRTEAGERLAMGIHLLLVLTDHRKS